jgi:transposase InsO family protein
MGRPESCLDNAVAESFVAALKIEFVERQHYRTRPPRRSASLDLLLRWESAYRSSAGALGSPVVAEL